MKNKVYHLANCTTCIRIIHELQVSGEDFEFQDIKTERITPTQIDQMQKMAGSYEALFSRRAMKFRELGLGQKKLEESDYRQFILDEYTFLKRPVFLINGSIYIGNTKKTVEAVAAAIGR